MTLKPSSLIMMLWTFNMEWERYWGQDKQHTLWARMLILVLNEQIYHMQHIAMNLESISYRLIVTDIHIVLHKIDSCFYQLKKSSQEVMYSSKHSYSNYMYFIGCETCDKSIWTSNKSFLNTNTIIKHGIPRIYQIYISFVNIGF